MQRLQRIDEHASNVMAAAQHAQRIFGHVFQSIGLLGREGISDAWLNVTPPAMIGPAKTHQMRPAGVVTGKPHRLHDRLCPGHVKRDFVLSGNLLEPLNVIGDHRMVRTKHRAEFTHALRALFDARLVKVVPKDVHAIGTGQIVEAIAVEIGDGDAARRLNKSAGAQVLTHKAAELEGHTIGVRELKIGDAFFDLRRQPGGFRKPVTVKFREAREAGAAAPGNVFRRPVRTKELAFVIFIERDQRRNPPCHFGMSGQRPMLCLRKLQPRLQLRQQCEQHHRAERRENKKCESGFHQINA